MEIANAVSWVSAFSGTIGGMPSWSSRSATIGMQIRPATVGRHEVDGFRGDLLGGDDEVAFVLTVRVVDDDHDPPRLHLLERFFDRGEIHLIL